MIEVVQCDDNHWMSRVVVVVVLFVDLMCHERESECVFVRESTTDHDDSK